MLPGSLSYLELWLRKALSRGGWGLAARAIGYVSEVQAQDWRTAASEAVLIGILKNEIAAEHLQWICEQQKYYMPLLKSHKRQLSAKWVSIYSPSALRTPGAVTHKAPVVAIEVLPRSTIATPWATTSDGESLHVLYHLGPLERIIAPIENLDDRGKGSRFSTHRWASRLSLERARVLSELFLESEPEWRLFECLRAAEITFHLEPGPVRSLDAEEALWRTWFVSQSGLKARYSAPHGFLLNIPGGEKRLQLSTEELTTLFTLD